jgi:hypothetical protein
LSSGGIRIVVGSIPRHRITYVASILHELLLLSSLLRVPHHRAQLQQEKKMRLSFWRNKQPPHIYNEQTKFLATFLNNIGLASFTLGVLAPFFSHEVKWFITMPVGALFGGMCSILAGKILTELYPPL